jgi:glycosyltransferase involved in cell wall biosynthesis
LKLLALSYFFPPLGGAGVQRSLKFIRYLPEHGWDAEVVTVRQPAYWIRDPTLSDEIPESVAVHRVANPIPLGGSGGGKRRSTSLMRWMRWLASFLLVPDVYALWSRAAAREAERLLREGSFQALWTTSSPDSTHLAGLRLHKRFGVPWVADFRDPWVRRLSFAPPTSLHRRMHHRMEASVVQNAQKVVVTSERTREDFLQRYPSLSPERILVLTNGYDEEDFRNFVVDAPADRFRILHLGQLNPERSLLPLLDPLSDLLEEEPSLRERVEVTCIGPHYETHLQEARRLGLESVVRFLSPCSHSEGIAWLGRAHLLLLLEREGERGRLITPGKLFEYMKSGRKVLALVDVESDAARLVRETGAGWAFSPSARGEIAACLGERLRRFLSGEQESGASPEAIPVFERRNLSGRLAEVLSDLV